MAIWLRAALAERRKRSSKALLRPGPLPRK
jgi:hypothetical protein